MGEKIGNNPSGSARNTDRITSDSIEFADGEELAADPYLFHASGL